MPPAKITCYIDCVSPYSYFAFATLLRSRPLLANHNISLNILPFFLGAARDGSGNPWVPQPAIKEAFAKEDMKRSSKLALGKEVKHPEKFPILSLFPIRALTYIHRTYSSSIFESAFLAIFKAMWEDGQDVSTPPVVSAALEPLFPDIAIEELLKLALTPENKKAVMGYTKAAQDTGAFGAPWLVVDNADGQREMFWGSDRWEQVYAFLQVPYEPLRILPPREGTAKL